MLFFGSCSKSCALFSKVYKSGLLAVGLVALTAGTARATLADTVTFTTDITGANVTIDVGNTETYDFVINPGHTVSEIIGDFTIKKGHDASQDIFLSIYNNFNGTGHVNGAFTPNGAEVGSFSFTPGDVTQAYTSKHFDVQPINLLPGNYSAVLHSIAGGSGTDQYFFKNQGFSSTSNGTTIAIGTTATPTPPTETPEPSALASLGIGAATVAFSLRRRRRK